MTPSTERLNNFDAIRLFAAFQVLITHAHHHFGLTRYTWLNFFVSDILVHFPGVPIFFFMSGYLVYSSADRLKANWLKYAWHRVLRIFPAIWVALGFTILALVAFQANHQVSLQDWVTYILAQGTILQSYSPDSFHYFGVGTPNGSLWTISIELQLYVILPFVLLAYRKMTKQFIVIVSVALIYTSHLLYTNGRNFLGEFDQLVSLTALPHLRFFLLGALLRRFKDQTHHIFAGQFTTWFVSLLAYRILIIPALWHYLPFYWLDFIGDFALMGVVLAAAFTAKEFSSTLLRGADYSYGLYIYHMIVINIMLQSFSSISEPIALFGICIIVSFLLAYFSWHYVEKRALKLKDATPFFTPTRKLNPNR